MIEEMVLKFIQGFDPQTIISLVVVTWFMNKGMREDIKSLKTDIKSMQEDIKDLDRRLCRIEGAITSKDCCVLKQDQNLKKVE